ncbi:MAG: hypothetical protein LBL72_09555 [Candidatus Accumulibacter sp.]|nr:hypothetical protein [Accumulibacter sp.]
MKNDRKFFLSAVFLISLLLSVVATVFNPIIGRDGALYMDIASLATTDLSGAYGAFNWPWYPILIGWLSHASRINPEYLWRVLGELMLATACVLAVDMVHQKRPGLIFWASLAVLSIPAFNIYRGEVIRENGFWCFSVCALWMLFRHEQTGCRTYLFGMTATILAATFFRFEAMVLFFVFPLSRGVRALASEGDRPLRRFAPLLVAVGALVAVAGIWLAAWKYELLHWRFVDLSQTLVDFLLNGIGKHFTPTAEKFAEIMPFKYSREDAGLILFFGFSFYLLWKIARTLGVFVVPAAMSVFSKKSTDALPADQERHESYPWLSTDIAALIFFAVWFIFMLYYLFLSMRYTTLMGFLLLPRIAEGLERIVSGRSRLKISVVAISAAIVFANVISISPPKTHLREAGKWLAENLKESDRLYLDDPRLAYYAGWKFSPSFEEALDVALAQTKLPYSHFILELKAEKEIQRFAANGLRPLTSFSNRDSSRIYVVFLRTDGAQKLLDGKG